MKEPKKISSQMGMNPHMTRREQGQKSPKPNLGMVRSKPVMKTGPRGR